MQKKSQAAMEFLMTYGWAILVVLVSIGALAYFGLLNPQRFLPSSCTISPGIGCGEFRLVSGASVSTIYIKNGVGSNLESVSISITPEGESSVSGNLDSSSCGGTNTIDEGANCEVTFTGLTTSSAGSRFKGSTSFTYTKSGETLSHSISGSIVTRIES